MKNIKTVSTIKLLAILFISSLTITSCSKSDDDDDHHDEELITTVTYTLTNGNNVVTLKFVDLDGEGVQMELIVFLVHYQQTQLILA